VPQQYTAMRDSVEVFGVLHLGCDSPDDPRNFRGNDCHAELSDVSVADCKLGRVNAARLIVSLAYYRLERIEPVWFLDQRQPIQFFIFVPVDGLLAHNFEARSSYELPHHFEGHVVAGGRVCLPIAPTGIV
jgi:hypothetical protein